MQVSITINGISEEKAESILNLISDVPRPKAAVSSEVSQKASEEPFDDPEEPSADSPADPYAHMSRGQLKEAVRNAGLMKRIRDSVTEDEMRAMLRGTTSQEEEEDDVNTETVNERPVKGNAKPAPPQEEEEEEEEVEEEEDDEVVIEKGMVLKVKIKGKTQKGKVLDIDYEAGKVKVKAEDGKLYRVSPEALSK